MSKAQFRQLVKFSQYFDARDISDINPKFWSWFGYTQERERFINFLLHVLWARRHQDQY